MSDMQCPRCFGRGYQPEGRKPSKRNPDALGFYARNCPRCGGTGSVESIFRVHVRGRWKRFDTMDEAKQLCEQVWQTRGVMLTIVEAPK